MFISNHGRTMLEVLRPEFDLSTSVTIVTGYISPSGCEALALREHSQRACLRLVVGRALEEGLPQPTYDYLQVLAREARARGGGVRVADPSCHSKMYLFADAQHWKAWVGSSNLTEHGLQGWVEANVATDDPVTCAAVSQECERLWTTGAPLDDPRLGVYRTSGRSTARIENLWDMLPTEPGASGALGVCLSLLGRNGEVQEKAGLNWWNAGGRVRNLNEAYIALPVEIAGRADVVFGRMRKGTTFQAVMHDGTTMQMVLEGSSSKGSEFPKQIASNRDKTILGQWILRDMLRLPRGKVVTLAELEAYGRTNICFYRIGTDPSTGEAVVFVDFRP